MQENHPRKKQSKEKRLQLKTRVSWKTYINKRNQANKICIQQGEKKGSAIK
jgi:hypothetical protein